jgi:hypothetical protein
LLGAPASAPPSPVTVAPPIWQVPPALQVHVEPEQSQSPVQFTGPATSLFPDEPPHAMITPATLPAHARMPNHVLIRMT